MILSCYIIPSLDTQSIYDQSSLHTFKTPMSGKYEKNKRKDLRAIAVFTAL